MRPLLMCQTNLVHFPRLSNMVTYWMSYLYNTVTDEGGMLQRRKQVATNFPSYYLHTYILIYTTYHSLSPSIMKELSIKAL